VRLDKKAGGVGGIKATLQLLRENEAVLVFPEGTRTVDGSLSPFMPGFCAIARRSGATIVPVAIEGAFAALPRGTNIPRPSEITVVLGPAIRAHEYARLTDQQIIELTTARINAARRAANARR
jgi:1-acyl-sn-glycerol-3-phosphate acyltransferase